MITLSTSKFFILIRQKSQNLTLLNLRRMAEADIITLDSDEEDNSTNTGNDQYLNNGSNGVGVTIKRIPTAPKVIPRSSGGMPGPSGSRKAVVPKKPGVFPPFALFSQEKRIEILSEQPNVSFGEVGRKLGEMWHALSEVEKEEYRRRAREISEKKMSDYQENLRKLPPQQRQLAISQANQPKKRTKTHGYAIFSAEMRKNLGNAMSPQETANVIAESWRSASPAVRRDYEDRAARINAVQQRRATPGMVNRPVNPHAPSQQHAYPNQFNNSSNASGLKISSVSSLSPQAKRRPILPRPTVPQGPKLPSGITISRVEPEVSIVDEQPSVSQLPAPTLPLPKPNFINRGRPGMRRPNLSPAAQAAMRVRAQLRNNQQVQSSSQSLTTGNGHHRGAMVNPRGRPFLNSRGAPVYRMPGQSGLKRMAPAGRGVAGNMMGGPAHKMPRMNMPRVEQKLCRSCGLVGPVGCKLAERPEVLQNLSELTLTPIDLVKDQVEGYPAEICRRCLSSITNCTVFKKTFCDGQEKLKARVVPPAPMLPLPPDLAASASDITESEPSIDNSSPSVSMGQEESILPDLDLDMDFGENPANVPQPVNIKEEKVRVITPSMEKIRIKSEVSKPMCSENIVEGGSEEKLVASKEPKKEDNGQNETAEAECKKEEEGEQEKSEKQENGSETEESKSKEESDVTKPAQGNNDPLNSEQVSEESTGTLTTDDPLNCISDGEMQREDEGQSQQDDSSKTSLTQDSSPPEQVAESEDNIINGQEDFNLCLEEDEDMHDTENTTEETVEKEAESSEITMANEDSEDPNSTVATGDENDESFVSCIENDEQIADQTLTNTSSTSVNNEEIGGDPFEVQEDSQETLEQQGDNANDGADAFITHQSDKEETVCL